VVGVEQNSFFIVMEYLEHDLHSLMEDIGKPFTVSEVKLLLHQLISAVHHLHEHWIIHRDIKTSNLLYSNKGYLKLCDMGLARDYYDPPRKMTPNVVTLWYRAPEVLLGMEQYGEPIDMWSVGCIFGELLDNKPMFDGRGEIDLLKKIFALLGSPNAAVWPAYPAFMKSKGFAIQDTNRYNHLKSRYPQLTQAGYDLMNRLLAYDPAKRITAAEAMAHPWFSERPLAKETHLMPTFPSRSDGGRPQQRQESRQVPQDVQQSILLQEQQHVFGAHERHYERG
jgi:cell division cycle 2-like